MPFLFCEHCIFCFLCLMVLLAACVAFLPVFSFWLPTPVPRRRTEDEDVFEHWGMGPGGVSEERRCEFSIG